MKLVIAALLALATVLPASAGSRIAIMPLVLSADFTDQAFSWECSQLSDRLSSELFSRYDCRIISRHNTLALQAEKALAALGEHPDLASLRPCAADFVVTMRNNTRDRWIAVELHSMGDPKRVRRFEGPVEELFELRFAFPRRLAEQIAEALELKERRETPDARSGESGTRGKEVIALLSPRLSIGLPAELAGEVEGAAGVGLSLAAGDVELVERARIREIVREHYLAATLESMPGAERALGMLMGATRLVEITVSRGDPAARDYRVDVFSTAPLAGCVEAAVSERFDRAALANPERWRELLASLRVDADAADLRTPAPVDPADDALRAAELEFHLKEIEANHYVAVGQGNMAVLSQCETASALSDGSEEVLVRLAQGRVFCRHPGAALWPGCRMSNAMAYRLDRPFLERSGELEQLDGRNRDVFGPLADALVRIGSVFALCEAVGIRSDLKDFAEALAITRQFPPADSLSNRDRLFQTRMRAYALMGLGRHEEARDAILALGRFDRIDMLMAVDACHGLGDEERELRLLWRNRHALGFDQLYYQRDLFLLKVGAGEVESAIDYFRNQIGSSSRNAPVFRKAYLEVLRDQGRRTEALEAATVSLHDSRFMRIVDCREVVESILGENPDGEGKLKQPHAVLQPPAGVRLELHPIECDPDLEVIVDLARRVSRIWGMEVAVYPRVDLPRVAPIYHQGGLSFDHEMASHYVRLLRPAPSEGCLARMHACLRDVHSKKYNTSGNASIWGGFFSLRGGEHPPEEVRESNAAVLSGLALRKPFFLTYHEQALAVTGWDGMPDEYPCLFGASGSTIALYQTTLTPAGARLYAGFDLARVADVFAQAWKAPEWLAATEPVREAIPDLEPESPEPVYVIKPKS